MFNGKKSQILLVKIMLAILLLAFIVIIVQPTQETIEYGTNSSMLNCSSPSISEINKVTCNVLDPGLLFYFIGTLIAVSLAVIQGKKTLAGVIEAITIFIVVVLITSPVKTLILQFRTNLSCGAAGLSLGTNMLCIFIDLWLFYFVILALSAVAVYFWNGQK